MNTDEKLASVLRTLKHTSAALRTVNMALNTACVDLAQAIMALDKADEVGVAMDAMDSAPPVDSVEAALEGRDAEAVFDA